MDYELTLTVKNAPLLNLMRENGYTSIAELARAIGCSRSTLDGLARLTRGVYGVDCETPSKHIERIAQFFGCHVEDLVPASHIRTPLKQSKFVAQVAEHQMEELAQSAQDPSKLLEIFETESRDAFSDMLDVARLNDRHKKVIEMRYRDKKTLDECGESLGVSRERIRQMELNALRILRQPLRKTDIVNASGMYAASCGLDKDG